MIDIINSVKHYQPAFWDVDNSRLLESNRSNILYANEQNEKVQQASTDLMAAINQLDINEDYRYVKDELFNNLDEIINSTLQNYGGNLRYAINDIQSMTRDILSSPKITGLVETNQQYKKWKAEIEGRKDISDDIKQMTIEKNPYNFSLQYKTDKEGNQILDDNGNPISVGYNDWKPTTHPVEQMDYNTMIRTGLSYINPNVGSNETIIYYKKDDTGKMIMTNDPSEAKFYSIDGRGYQEITTADVELSLIQAYLANPKFAASLNQDYELAKWKAEKGNDIYGYKNLDGTIKTKEEYMLGMFENISKTYSYKHETITKKLQKMPSDGKYGSFSEYIKIRGLENTSNYQGTEEVYVNPADVTAEQEYVDSDILTIINNLDSLTTQ